MRLLCDPSDCRKSWKVRRRSGRSSFSALRRALVGNERTLLKDFPSIDGTFNHEPYL